MSQPHAYVRDWMTSDPVTVTAETSLLSAYDLMLRRGIRRLPVVDADGRLCGIITRSDIHHLVPFIPGGEDHSDVAVALGGQTVEEVMTMNPITVTPEDPIQRVAKQMLTRKISGVPVVANEKIAGIITESDIFRFVVEGWTD